MATLPQPETLTPAMRQYLAAKEQHPDCLMFCRMGDFYELFFEDAIVAARELQLTLTARDREKKQPMCGVPYHAAEIYIQRLLRKGFRIALCEQMEDPKLVKGKQVVRREVTRVLTPGTSADPALAPGDSCWLAAIVCHKSSVGLALVDLSTGDFRATEFTGPAAWSEVVDELTRIRPLELIHAQGGLGLAPIPHPHRQYPRLRKHPLGRHPHQNPHRGLDPHPRARPPPPPPALPPPLPRRPRPLRPRPRRHRRRRPSPLPPPNQAGRPRAPRTRPLLRAQRLPRPRRRLRPQPRTRRAPLLRRIHPNHPPIHARHLLHPHGQAPPPRHPPPPRPRPRRNRRPPRRRRRSSRRPPPP